MVGVDVISMTVDSKPMVVSPPSMMASTLPLKSSNTCLNAVDDGLPDILADGAAIGLFDSLMSFNAASWLGILNATVFSPPVVV